MFDGITWEKTKQELKRFEDWSQGIRRIPKGAKPEIIVNDGKITFNGKILKIGDDIESWKKVIGGNPRAMLDRRIYVWDDLGFKVGIGWTNTKVTFINIIFRCKERGAVKVCPENGGPGNTYEPQNFFTGYVEYEGGPIDSRSTVLEANRLIRGRVQYGGGCGTGLCSSVWGKYGYIVSDPDIDGRGYESVFYGVSFGGNSHAAFYPPKADAEYRAPHENIYNLNEITWGSTKQTFEKLRNWVSGLPVALESSESEINVNYMHSDHEVQVQP
ncbi:DUF7738 domain-containing protein [Pseudomonas huanghezhanensis]|uniref:DUF7738 domain-containing protein n=1 Tax=Pseudomonas huanghezhanensis TaxID=3002903 RepID=UPI00228570D6|nr:hypothetical protein [Pseudomonas sp. BSw22131]